LRFQLYHFNSETMSDGLSRSCMYVIIALWLGGLVAAFTKITREKL